MTYDTKDMLQQALGAFSAVFFIYILRGGNPLWINPTVGLVIGLIWLLIVYNPFIKHVKEAKIHFMGAIVISLIITTTLAVAFGVATFEELQSFKFFGSLAWLAMLIAIPVAVLFDKKNMIDIVSRYYIRGGKRR